jgi:hypothetical protein
MLLSERRRIGNLALAARLPTVCERREHVEDGALMVMESICVKTGDGSLPTWIDS